MGTLAMLPSTQLPSSSLAKVGVFSKLLSIQSSQNNLPIKKKIAFQSLIIIIFALVYLPVIITGDNASTIP